MRKCFHIIKGYNSGMFVFFTFGEFQFHTGVLNKYPESIQIYNFSNNQLPYQWEGINKTMKIEIKFDLNGLENSACYKIYREIVFPFL